MLRDKPIRIGIFTPAVSPLPLTLFAITAPFATAHTASEASTRALPHR